MKETKEKILLTAEQIARAVEKMATYIISDCPASKPLVLVGIASGGVPLAQRLKEMIESKKHRGVLFGILDITFYRDDLAMREKHPVIKGTDILFSLDHTCVYLVDDVLFSGRTTRAALDALVDFGRPDVIRLLTLIDRGHRQLPICADCAGATVETATSDRVEVVWQKAGAGKDQVKLISTESAKD